MKAILFVSIVCYSVLLLLCVYYVASFVASAMHNGRRPAFPVSTVTAAGVAAVSLYFIISRRCLSGYYAVYIAFVMSPTFLSNLTDGNVRFRLVPAAVTEAVAAIVILISCLSLMKADITMVAMLLMLAFLVFSTGHAIWKISGKTRKFDGTVSAKETLVEIADTFYLAVLVLLLSLGKAIGGQTGWLQLAGSTICIALMCGLVAAMDRRRAKDRVFLVCGAKEKMISETVMMERNITVDATKLNPSYETLYRRLTEFFENDRPYLDPNLTLTGVAQSLLTNKQYLSMTINAYAGKNFCQFVSSYRVRYIIEVYIRDRSLRLSELALKCGFRTVHSFSVAFNLNMNMSPSQWCRKLKGTK